MVDDSADGNIALLVTHKQAEYRALIISIYLPPDNSIYGIHCDPYFENLTNLLYKYNSCDMSVIMGDFNSRVGHLKDYVEEIDDVPPRTVINETDNSHGQSMIDFLIECKMSIVNGRVYPPSDNYTCLLIKGRSVVDYCFVSHENLKNVSSFALRTVTDIVEELGLQAICVGRVSDHSLLTFDLKMISEETEMISEEYTPRLI